MEQVIEDIQDNSLNTNGISEELIEGNLEETPEETSEGILEKTSENIQGSAVIYFDGGVMEGSRNRKFLFGSVVEYSSPTSIIDHSEILTYCKEGVFPENIETTYHYNFAIWDLKKIAAHTMSYSAELYTVFKGLEKLIETNRLAGKESVTFIVDNKGVEETLYGVPFSKSYFCTVYQRKINQLLGILSKSHILNMGLHIQRIRGNEMKIILGH